MDSDDGHIEVTSCSVHHKGRGGQSCKVQANSQLSGPSSAVDVVGPENGVLPVKLSIRIDGIRVKRDKLRNSGLLQAVKRFFREVC